MTWLLVTRSPVAQSALLGLVPQRPYSAVLVPSNWELWRNFPGATQQSSAGTKFRADGMKDWARINHWVVSEGRPRELPSQLPVGEVFNMTVSWRRGAASISGAARG